MGSEDTAKSPIRNPLPTCSTTSRPGKALSGFKPDSRLVSNVSSYNQYLEKKGLKSTHQRDVIVGEFFKKHQHLTVEELWGQVKKIDTKIGYATVYRTLKLLTESGLAYKREFGEGQARFEHVTDHHHDHLICMGCGKIIEFENDQIEALQEKICRKHRFRLAHHKMELYGHCEDCIQKGEV